MPVAYPVMVPEPASVPVMTTLSPTTNVPAAHENAPAVFVMTTVDNAVPTAPLTAEAFFAAVPTARTTFKLFE